jgi:hypothetical protein
VPGDFFASGTKKKPAGFAAGGLRFWNAEKLKKVIGTKKCKQAWM